MTTISVMLLCLCFSTEPQQTAKGRKPYEQATPGAPSAERRAALQSTIAKRRAYRARSRGSAQYQQAQMSPVFGQMLNQAQQMAADLI
jgi:hypothetical protein